MTQPIRCPVNRPCRTRTIAANGDSIGTRIVCAECSAMFQLTRSGWAVIRAAAASPAPRDLHMPPRGAVPK
jgi:hypothetical protein